MYRVETRYGNHNWKKKNLVTLKDKRGYHDIFKCNCGLKGKSYQLGWINLKGSYSDKKVYKCPLFTGIIDGNVKVTRCTAQGKIFGNLIPNSVHTIIDVPKGKKDDGKGVWVMGVGVPVKLLNGEFIRI